MVVERFAPSPTGPLHLGHAYSAGVGWSAARARGGRFLLRMEDLDRSRVRPTYYRAIEADLAWLGLDWDGAVLCQSDRSDAYANALARLDALGLVYACRCSRRDVQAAASAPQEGGAPGLDGPLYPGTCRDLGLDWRDGHALRLNMRRSLAVLAQREAPLPLFRDLLQGPTPASQSVPLDTALLRKRAGDIVLRRRDGVVAYHLAVVIDDAYQAVTHVTRGADLFEATQIHVLLQALLGLATPVYRHHRLIRDSNGRRLAKRDDARSIATYREAGETAQSVLARVGINRQSVLAEAADQRRPPP